MLRSYWGVLPVSSATPPRSRIGPPRAAHGASRPQSTWCQDRLVQARTPAVPADGGGPGTGGRVVSDHGPDLSRRDRAVPRRDPPVAGRTTCPRDGAPRDSRMTKDEQKAFNREWTKKLFDGGWICASWPKEYGGKGLSLMESVVLNEEFARAEAPLRADFFGDTLVGPTILQWATEEQKQQFIPGILNGTIAWCQGFSEPDAGSDLASLKTRAELDGDEWVINGQKVWTTQAQFADYIFLLARTDPDAPKHAGISYLLVPDEAGRHRGPAHRPGGRQRRLQRDLLHQRPLPRGERGRRGQQRVEGGHDHPGVRAGLLGHHRAPALPTRARPDHRRGPGERDEPRPPDPPAPGHGVDQGQDHGDQRLPLAHRRPQRHPPHGRPRRLQQDVLVRAPQGGHGAGHRHPRSRRPDPHRRPDRRGRRAGRSGDGTTTPSSDLQASFFFSRSESIWGGTAEIQRNIVGERVLGPAQGAQGGRRPAEPTRRTPVRPRATRRPARPGPRAIRLRGVVAGHPGPQGPGLVPPHQQAGGDHRGHRPA